MKDTLFFRKNLTKSIIYTFLLIFLSGCIPNPEPSNVKNCPKITILYPIKDEIQKPKKLYFKKIDDEYVSIKKKDLKRASLICQKNRLIAEKQKKYIKFYEKELLLLRKNCSSKKKGN